MKHLRETFTDQEWENLKAIKEKTKKNWHNFIIQSAIRYAVTFHENYPKQGFEELYIKLAKTQ